MKTKVFLIGPVLTRSGYGEQARFALRALKSREDLFDIYIQPLQWGNTSWISEESEEKTWINKQIEKTIAFIQQGGKFDVSVQVTIPNEWKKTAAINIGYTAGIESNKVHHTWIQAVNQMDQVIVVSNHAKNVFEATTYTGIDDVTQQQINLETTTEICAVNYPTKTFDDNPDINLGLEPKINFLSVAQWGPRKNVNNMIRWFVEEFKDEEVGFVLKTNRAKNCLMDREACEGLLQGVLADYEDLKCKVYLLHGDMTDAEMHALYTNEQISAFVGIPHGEGFGLPFFEAAYSGLPVIATGWSGQLDFLVDEKGNDAFYNVSFDINAIGQESVWDGILIKESAWAYARETSYKENLRKCYNDIKSGETTAATEYADTLKERFSPDKMYAKFIESMGLEIDTEWTEALSQIEIL